MLFLSILIYLTYFEFFMKDKVVNNEYNQRLTEYEENVLRGSILDRNGEVLAYSEGNGESQVRIYPYKGLYSNIIGYSSKTYNKYLLEKKYNNYLVGMDDFSSVVDQLTGGVKRGNDLVLTIDNNLQQLASQLLKGKAGAVVALDPKTGEVLAMLSNPGFDPSQKSLEKNWNTLVESTDTSPFLNRAVQGLYPPGSIFKVIMAQGAIEYGLQDFTVKDEGKVTIEDKEFKNAGSKKYGNIGLEQGLVHSSNVYFTQLSIELGKKNLIDTMDKTAFNQKIPFDIRVKENQMDYEKMDDKDMASVGIGQGKLLVTPLYMAMVASSIANNGIMMEPIMVNKVTNNLGITIKREKQEIFKEVMTKDTAQKLNEMMQKVVSEGTGKNASINGSTVAGKTGTAQNEKEGQEHAWFIGFAPASDPQIAVSVILEYSGSSGGEAAAPVARKLMEQWLK